MSDRPLNPIPYWIRYGKNDLLLVYMANVKQSNGNEITSTTTVVVKEVIGKDATQDHMFAFTKNDLPSAIGSIVSKVSGKGEFIFLGCKFKLPALTSGNSNPERAAAMFKQFALSCFPADSDRTAEVSKDSDQGAALLSLNKKGINFSALNKVAVIDGIKFWEAAKKSVIALHKQTAIKENTNYIAIAKENKAIVKDMKAANLAEITGLQIKYAKQIGSNTAKLQDVVKK